MEEKSKILEWITINVLVPICIGFCAGWAVIKIFNIQTYPEKQGVEQTISGYKSQFSDLITEMGSKMEADSSSVDRIINYYILKSFSLYEQVYEFTSEQNLAIKNSDQFKEAAQVMSAIQQWQMEYAERRRRNFLTGGGLAEIYVIEAEQSKQLTDTFARKACQDVLEITPNNKQAQEIINKLYTEK